MMMDDKAKIRSFLKSKDEKNLYVGISRSVYYYDQLSFVLFGIISRELNNVIDEIRKGLLII